MAPICTLDDRECGFVYVIGCKEGFYKIGKSRNVLQRFHQIRGGSCSRFPFRLWLVYVFNTRTMTEMEYDFHRMFAESRLEGEWFKLSDRQLKFLELYARFRLSCRV